MRTSAFTMLIVSLVLWGSQAFAQASPPAYSADALYNEGNSYARAGKPGLAVLSFERAALLAPGDADINANLTYVRAAAQVPARMPGHFAQFVLAISPTWAAWLAVLGVALVGAGLVTMRVARRQRWMARSGVVLGAGLIGLTVCNAVLLWPRLHEAVVLVDQTPARVSPAPMADTAFVLREADSVSITAEHEDFVFIRSREGSSGWVARASLGEVVPVPRGSD
jgi:hypothetical protein